MEDRNECKNFNEFSPKILQFVIVNIRRLSSNQVVI